MERSSLFRTFLKYVSLTIVGLISSTIVILVDYMFVAQAMGQDGLAALSFVSPVYTIVLGFGMILGIGGGAKYAEYTAKGEQEEANKYFTLSAKLGVIFSVFLILAGLFFAIPITRLVGAEGHLVYLAADYVRVVLLGSPIFLLYFMLLSFERNDNSPKVAMVVGLIATIGNIILDYVFIIVLDFGTGGVVGATLVAMICALLFLCIYRLRHKANYALVRTRFAFSKIRTVCAVGGPFLVSVTINAFLIITFNLSLFRLVGEVGVAAFGIITMMTLVIQQFFEGVGQGMQPIASYCYGKGYSSDLKKLVRYAVSTTTFLAIIAISMTFLFADNVIAFYNTEGIAELANLSGQGMRIYFLALAFFGITVVAVSFLSVTSSPAFGLVMSVLQGGGIAIPLVLILSRIFGVTGVWATYPLAEFVLSIVSVIFLVRANRIHKKMFTSKKSWSHHGKLHDDSA